MRVDLLPGVNPSAADILNALARAYDHTGKLHAPRYTLAFSLGDREVQVHVTGVSYLRKAPDEICIVGTLKNGLDWRKVEIFYNATTRSGYLELSKSLSPVLHG